MSRFGPAMVLAAAALLAQPAAAVACGYDGVMGNSFAARHPRSIEVAFAVRDAVAAGMLDGMAVDPVRAGPSGYWRAAGRIQSFLHRLSVGADGPRDSIAIV